MAAHSYALGFAKMADPQGLRTVGVLTKPDAQPSDGPRRGHIETTMKFYSLKHGYVVV